MCTDSPAPSVTGSQKVPMSIIRVAELAPAEAIAKRALAGHHGDRRAARHARRPGVGRRAGVRFAGAVRAAAQPAFLDQTGGLWARRALADKVATFHVGLHPSRGLRSDPRDQPVLYHWGTLVMPLGYTAPIVHETGNPYGSSWGSRKGAEPDDALETARHQGRRLARIAAALHAGRVD